MLSNSDDPNDEYASALVESQLIVERMAQAPWNGDSQPVTMPTLFFVKAMQEQLRAFQAKRTEKIQQNGEYFNSNFILSANNIACS